MDNNSEWKNLYDYRPSHFQPVQVKLPGGLYFGIYDSSQGLDGIVWFDNDGQGEEGMEVDEHRDAEWRTLEAAAKEMAENQ